MPKVMGSVCAREGNGAHMKVQDWKPLPEEDCAGTQELPWVSTTCRAPASSHVHSPAREPLPETIPFFSIFRQLSTLDSDRQLLRTAARSGGWYQPREHHSQVSTGLPVLCPAATSWFCWLDAQSNRAGDSSRCQHLGEAKWPTGTGLSSEEVPQLSCPKTALTLCFCPG